MPLRFTQDEYAAVCDMAALDVTSWLHGWLSRARLRELGITASRSALPVTRLPPVNRLLTMMASPDGRRAEAAAKLAARATTSYMLLASDPLREVLCRFQADGGPFTPAETLALTVTLHLAINRNIAERQHRPSLANGPFVSS